GVLPMREVGPRHVHPGARQLQDRLPRRRRRAERADDPRAAHRKAQPARRRATSCPGYLAASSSSSSMRSRRLYLATRSLRDGAPVLICPALTATARSAIEVSSVSPERWEMTLV